MNAHTIKGPVMVLGAGGFIGRNLIKTLSAQHKDILGFSYKDFDLRDNKELRSFIFKYKPQTVINLVSYGGYEDQTDIKRIYTTNFNSTVELIELLKQTGFSMYLHAGSSSEYGSESDKPDENIPLKPNSHYAISKAACSQLIEYYGEMEHLPVAHLRLYSVYGPYEKTSRLIPTLLLKGKQKKYPPLVDPFISRDFIHVSDVIDAFLQIAAQLEPAFYGESFNIGSGKATTIRELARLVKKICNIPSDPVFSTMKKRRWDHGEVWCANIDKVKKYFHWKPKISLKEGLRMTLDSL